MPTLSASTPRAHNGPVWSRNCFSCAAGNPNRVGDPNAKPSAHSRSSSVASDVGDGVAVGAPPCVGGDHVVGRQLGHLAQADVGAFLGRALGDRGRQSVDVAGGGVVDHGDVGGHGCEDSGQVGKLTKMVDNTMMARMSGVHALPLDAASSPFPARSWRHSASLASHPSVARADVPLVEAIAAGLASVALPWELHG